MDQSVVSGKPEVMYRGSLVARDAAIIESIVRAAIRGVAWLAAGFGSTSTR